MLRSQKLISFVDGGHPQPPKMVVLDENEQPNPEYLTWEYYDQFMLCMINSTLSEEILSHVIGLETSREVWKALGSTLAQHSKACELQLKHALQECKKGNSTIDEYLRTFKNICDSLGAIGCSVPDEDKSYWLLQGLGPNYESFTTTMLAKPSIPSYQEAVASLKIHNLRTSSLHKSYMESAYATQRGGRYNSRGRGRSFRGRGRGRGRFSNSYYFSTPQTHQPQRNANKAIRSSPTSSVQQPSSIICQIYHPSDEIQGGMPHSNSTQSLNLSPNVHLVHQPCVSITPLSSPPSPPPPPPVNDNQHGMTTRGKLGIIKPNPKYANISDTLYPNPSTSIKPHIMQ
ncbi:hypothetical protein GIB67_018511 [Kingdonia uniflora]|uniref:Uncharacterized protein n=1 Tax=Kingdonia uniflora TaxID=39325 RepID=A0A7J7LWC8_9MAGN|nr:hypothetical protein GIB67_018511 [Kingdonia uniflora]